MQSMYPAFLCLCLRRMLVETMWCLRWRKHATLGEGTSLHLCVALGSKNGDVNIFGRNASDVSA